MGAQLAEPEVRACFDGLPRGEPHKLARPEGPPSTWPALVRRAGARLERVAHPAARGASPGSTNGSGPADAPARRRAGWVRRPSGRGPPGHRASQGDGRPRGRARRSRRPRRGRRGRPDPAACAGRGPRRARPRLHPRDPARPLDAGDLYFRADVRGLENIPEEGPVLLVGNHSGGNMTVDTGVFTLAFSTYFGVERRFHQLAHNLVLHDARPRASCASTAPWRATPANAARALSSGAALLVYPGGDYEVHRPTWESARVDFDGRKGFIRLALSKDVPIVPVVSIGGQETALFLSRGERLARAPAARPAVPAQGPADLARAPLGPERRRHARPPPAAGQDHDPGAAADPPARGVRRRSRHRRGLRRTWSGGCSAPSTRAAGGARACRCSADADREEASRSRRRREEIWERIDDPANYHADRGRASPAGGPGRLARRAGRPLLAAHARGLGRGRRR